MCINMHQVQVELSYLVEDRLTLIIPGPSFTSRVQVVTYFQDSNGLIRQSSQRTASLPSPPRSQFSRWTLHVVKVQ